MIRRLLNDLAVLFLPAWLLAITGCSVFGSAEQYDRTPAGWHVHWLDQGTISKGLLTREALYDSFDKAMERSITEAATKVGLARDYVAKTIRDRDALYTLYDDSMFNVAPGSKDAPTSTHASGITYGRSNTAVAYYLWVSVANGTALPAGTPAWTVHPNPNHADQTIYGKDDPTNRYPALGYELHWQFTLTP